MRFEMRKDRLVEFAANLTLVAFLVGCRNSDTITGLPTQTTPTPVPSVASGTYSGGGQFTWTSIQASRTLCPEITNQVGRSWPFHVTLRVSGSSVRLGIGEDPQEPAIYNGTLSGSAINATGIPMGGFSCPRDTTITPEVSSTLTAVLSGSGISGVWTELYTTGSDTVAFDYQFEATLTRQ